MYIIERKKNRSTLKGHPNASLFKFKMAYIHTYQGKKKVEGCPDTIYSNDTPAERALFLPPLNKEQREMWLEFQNNLPDAAFNFFAWSYPLFSSATDAVVCYTAVERNTEQLKQFSPEEIEYIKQVAATVGFNIQGVRPINQHNNDPKPTLTPKFHPNLKKFNGMDAVQKWIKTNFGPKGLIQVDVYDNLCYHQDNFIESWVIDANLQQISPVQKPSRYKEPVSVGSMIGNVESFESFQNQLK